MIRKATFDDIELIEDTYNEHFKHEMKHGAFTIFKKGIYPARKDAERASIMVHYMCMKKITVLQVV